MHVNCSRVAASTRCELGDDALGANGRAGLVGTNSIRQNYSREGGLDYIVQNGGTITDAVSTQVWSGAAQVHVSIVNWTKAKNVTQRLPLTRQRGDAVDSPWETFELPRINSALSPNIDVSVQYVCRRITDRAAKEKGGEKITPPDLPLPEGEQAAFVTADCIQPPKI